jgi:cyclic pyranopterin phosphate synthase
MVDISGKPPEFREAVAEGFIRLRRGTVEAIRRRKVEKGDVISVAQTAAILAIKRTPELVPLAHPIPITGADVDFKIERGGLRVRVTARSDARTGVEMEALAGVASALLTVWDMVKGLEKDERGQYPETLIEGIRVLRKVKG